MKIKRLEIVGFKSFVDRVCLDFSEGIAAVVGPNGCGKSNILDAIRWVMGEQSARNLRGRSMEDVIFGGSEMRKPVGMAEVSLILSNEGRLGPPALRDYPEIMVTRRLYRNGDSEYRLNKTPCRLLDITELFIDTGVGARAYSIIEQGKIGMILSARPEDRRFLIEEAAGISKFKSRKQAALRKIEATRQNLLRLQDIISEVRRQLNALKRQARKAEQYRDYREQLKALEVALAAERFRDLGQQWAVVESACEEQGRQAAMLERQAEKVELEIEARRLEQIILEKEQTRRQQQFFELTTSIQQIESRLQYDQKGIAAAQRQQEQLTAELESLGEQLIDTEGEVAALRSSETGAEQELARQESRLEQSEAALASLLSADEAAQQILEEDRQSLLRLSSELARLDNRREEVRRRQQLLAEQRSRYRQELQTVREQQDGLRERIADSERSLAVEGRQRDALEGQLETARRHIQRVRQQKEEGESPFLQTQEALSRRRSRLESLRDLERAREGCEAGVRTLLADGHWGQVCAGLAADMLAVPAEWEVALEAVLGDRLQALLPGRVEDVFSALELLRGSGGRAALLLPAQGPLQQPVEVVGAKPLLSLVRPDEGLAEEAAALLDGLFLVEDLAPYLGGSLPRGVTLVTAAGDSLSHRGLLRGGATKALDGGLLQKRREIKELIAEVARLEDAFSELQRQRLQQKEEILQSEETLQQLTAALQSLQLRLAAAEKDLDRQREDLRRLQERAARLGFEDDRLAEESETLRQGLIEDEGALEARKERRRALETSVAAVQEQQQERRLILTRERESVTALKVALAGLREREDGNRRNLRRLEKTLEDGLRRQEEAGRRLQETVREQQGLEKTLDRQRVEMEVLLRRQEEEARYQQTCEENVEAGAAALKASEAGLKELRSRHSLLQDGLRADQVRLREIELEMTHLRESVLDRYRIDLQQQIEQPTAVDEQQSQQRMKELRRLLEDMGEVNLMAIEEFQQLEQRWTFLTEQEADLRTSMEGLQTAISKINRTTRKRFSETFRQVNDRFQEVFPRLFLGGKAELRLTDEQDLLETGIDIAVQPPGKKLQNVNLLSGGEKALTAVALIFAIFLIKPSPFCILDEVDAPLDDANIERFNELVREMSDKSQFILITHNKRTMNVADTLYGVTMESPGVSKLVSVRINDF